MPEDWAVVAERAVEEVWVSGIVGGELGVGTVWGLEGG